MTRPRAVPAHTVRDHIAAFTDAGYTSATVGEAAGVHRRTVQNVINGRHATVKSGTADVLLKLTHLRVLATAIRLGKPVPAVGVTRRLRALYALGWTCQKVSEATSIGTSCLQRTLNGEHVHADPDTWQAVCDFYDAHWSTPRVPVGRIEAGWVTRARQTAEDNGWAPAMAWDDERIDDPAATPDLGAPVDARTKVHVDDVEWLLRNERHTWTTIAARFGVTVNAIDITLRRHGRLDLIARIGDATREAA